MVFLRHAQASADPFWRKKNSSLPDRACAGWAGACSAPFWVLGKPTSWANQSNEGWHGQTVQNPCKSYSSSAYINVGTVRIAFLWRKTVQNELFLQAVYEYTPCKNSISWRKTAQMSLGLAPLSPSSMLYVLYVLYGRQPAPLSPGPCYMCYMCYISQGNPPNIHSPRVPCYMCYMCYNSQDNPLNIHSPPAPCYMYYMCYMFCTREICTICAI